MQRTELLAGRQPASSRPRPTAAKRAPAAPPAGAGPGQLAPCSRAAHQAVALGCRHKRQAHAGVAAGGLDLRAQPAVRNCERPPPGVAGRRPGCEHVSTGRASGHQGPQPRAGATSAQVSASAHQRRGLRVDQPSLLGLVDHVERDPVLHAAGGAAVAGRSARPLSQAVELLGRQGMEGRRSGMRGAPSAAPSWPRRALGAALTCSMAPSAPACRRCAPRSPC